jgi:CMP-N,N'-diacetyllegionaminic acid synthase
MRNLGKIYAHIPARGGSKRVPSKNLRLLCGKPLISYAIECAKKCALFDDIFVNTDSDALATVAEKYHVNVYRRDAWLGSDEAKGDDVTADFIEKMKPDTLVMISSVCPLIEPTDVLQAIKKFRASDCDTLITCQQTQLQAFCNEVPVNIDLSKGLEATQNNPVIKVLNWAVTIWDAKSFLKSYRDNGNGFIGNNRYLMPIAPAKCVKISHEEDFYMAELLIRANTLQKETERAK